MSALNETAGKPALAQQLADFVANYAFADLPAKAIEHAEMLIASTLASAAAGSTVPSLQIVRSLEVERGGNPEAHLWFGENEMLPVAAIARVNAMMSDAAASDDSDLRNIVHAGTPACAAAFAVGELTDASGEDILAAIVLGYEVASRINNAMLGGLQRNGFHGCVVASFAAVTVAAKLLQLDARQIAHSIALTATSIGGLSKAAATSWAREYHAGLAAMTGVQSAQAAGKGFEAEPYILEMKGGFLDAFCDKPNADAVMPGLGKEWSILTEMGVKLAPGGHPYHAISEAAACAAIQGNIVPEDVVSITYRILHPTKGPQFPSDMIGMAHSAAYFAAVGVADRSISWEHASMDKIHDPRIRSLLAKIHIGEPPTADVARYKGATVIIETTDGRTLEATISAPRGAAIRGIEWTDIADKYCALIPKAGLNGAELDATLALIRQFRTASNVSELVGRLRTTNVFK
jgi:2-methylcitrate dehydratase PrpD